MVFLCGSCSCTDCGGDVFQGISVSGVPPEIWLGQRGTPKLRDLCGGTPRPGCAYPHFYFGLPAGVRLSSVKLCVARGALTCSCQLNGAVCCTGLHTFSSSCVSPYSSGSKTAG